MSSSSSPPVNATDMLLSLPPEILDKILARLPFKEVGWTCCLSHAWERRWESVPGLAICFRRNYNATDISHVLTRCAAHVEGFDVFVCRLFRRRALCWLRVLADKRVRSLNLNFESTPDDVHRGVGLMFPTIASAIYDCGDLCDLRLSYCQLPPPALSFAGLVLSTVSLPFAGAGAMLERVIAGAPDLDDLVLRKVSTGVASSEVEAWAIRAPKLRMLTLWMVIDNGGRIAERLPLLKTANIVVDCLLGSEDLLDTLWKVASVKVLNFVVYKREPCSGQ
uniref:F-box domain-containing protein n=1 Tax=Leersia perrieri TaxID=77586 RepID=A0A0D9X621_9ORYZ